MREEREFICVTCPVGCSIKAVIENDEIVEIVGNSCKRGQAFVREELSNPRRTLTTTVTVNGGTLALVPVRSSEPLPKHLVLDVARELRSVSLQAPVRARTTVLKNVLDTGVDIVTCRGIPAVAAQ